MSFLGSKPELKELKISSKNITSLGGLTNANFPKLETLDLKQASNLKDISALANGPKGSLSKIDLGDTQVKDITPLKGYNNLKILNIEKIAISEANRAAYTETIKSLVSLEELYMSYCKIQDKDTEMFRPLSNLKVLVLNICELTNTDFCEFLPVGMTKIGLYGNDISNMNNLTRFKNLNTVGISNNNVVDLSFLSKMTSLSSWGIRHAEGGENFPTEESVNLTIKESSIKDGKVEIDNPFVGVDGAKVSFNGAQAKNSENVILAEAQSQAPYDKITLTFKDLKANKYNLNTDYSTTLPNGLKLVANLKFKIEVENDVHVHKWGEVKYEWSSDNSECTAKRVCTLDQTHVESETVKATKSVKKPATEKEEGIEEYVAEFTNDWAKKQVKEVSIPMLEHVHKWGEVKYEWSSDNSECTAKRVCTLDQTHVESETVKATKSVKKPATEKEEGIEEYVAEFTNDWAKKQVKEVSIPMLEKPADKPVDKPDDKPAVKPTEKPDNKPVDKPVVKPTEKPADTSTDKEVVKSPKTGEENNMSIYVTLLALSGAVLAAFALRKKKNIK